MTIKGIDVSAYQKKPDWAKVAKDGVKVAILRITERYGIDTSFEHNFSGCKANKIKVGVYKFSYALTVAEIKKEADGVISTLNGRSIDYPVFLDLEWSEQRKLSKTTMESMIEAFRAVIEKAGYKFGIYTNKDWYNNVLPESAKKYDLWVAGYPANDVGEVVEKLRPSYGIGWQYSSKGKVSGITGNVDMNDFYKDYSSTNNKKEEPKVSEIDLIYKVMLGDVGYLEKHSNAYLDDKTKNAGYNNYTKFWRDTTKRGRMKAYGYSTTSGFAGGSAWAYCACGIDDAFHRALDDNRAKELLIHGDAAFINCETMYGKAKAIGRIFSKPQRGDLVLFKKTNGVHYHVEFVYNVVGDTMYTIGYNTSGASSVIANGGGVCAKKYSISGSRADYFRPAYKDSASAPVTSTGVSVTYLKKGSSGSAVKTMQTMLIALGYSCGSAGADGSFGDGTLAALKKFQADAKLTVDGVYGEESSKALNTKYAALSNNTSDKKRVIAKGVCTGNDVNVRSWAGTENGNIKSYPKLNKGNEVDIMDYDQKDTKGNLWYYIRIAGKYFGFVSAKYIAKK